MSWMLELYKTYEDNMNEVGKVAKRRSGRKYMLLPVGHIAQNAHIEVTIDNDGNFYQAKVLSKEEARTVIPCTEQSAGRTGNKAPHPLHDKLEYVAGDFEKYGGMYKKFSSYDLYIDQLSQWVALPSCHHRVRTIYNYVKQGRLIEDLVKSGIITLDHSGKMILKWSKDIKDEYGDKPALFEKALGQGSQDSAFVRFDTYIPSERNLNSISKKAWEDLEVCDSYSEFFKSLPKEQDICYVTGNLQEKATLHANGLRRAGDKAKLVSSNDTDGFTYLGRFLDDNKVVSISYDASQKAHNALKWLISKQGKDVDGRIFLVWANDAVEMVSPQEDSLTLFLGLNHENDNFEKISDTAEIFAEQVSKAIDGYKSNFDYKSQVIMMILDSANDSGGQLLGRLGVLYYNKLDTKEYLERIKNWHETCYWKHQYRKVNEKPVIFYGCPSNRDIVETAYSEKANEKLIQEGMRRLLLCVVSGSRVPLDIVKSAYHRAINPVAFKESEKWAWEKVLSVTCALINKVYERQGYNVALDVNNNQRDYLFGRLLAVADVLEQRALDANESRSTNAIRYMNAFASHPARTWQIIQANIQPYQERMGRKATYYNRLIDQIGSTIKVADFNDKPLSGVFLLGFYSQRNELYKSKAEREKEQDII